MWLHCVPAIIYVVEVRSVGLCLPRLVACAIPIIARGRIERGTYLCAKKCLHCQGKILAWHKQTEISKSGGAGTNDESDCEFTQPDTRIIKTEHRKFVGRK